MKTNKHKSQNRVVSNPANPDLLSKADAFMEASIVHKYSYSFTWLGRPIIQYPQDMVALQEIIWTVQPDLIIETGIAHGGSLIFSASMLELNAACGGPQDAEVLGIDVDIRKPNREAIKAHPMFKRISMLEGSSTSPDIVDQVKQKASRKQNILISLDSNHTHDHVLSELEIYGPLTSNNSYCIVFDTVIEDLPDDLYPDRPWSRGNNPKTAVREFLQENEEFEVDTDIETKLLITVARGGYLQRVC